MPQIKQTKSQSNEPSATTIKENKAFRDRLRDRYQPSQWVRVINIDNEPFSWQYFPSDGETTDFTDNGAVRVVTGRARFSGNYEQKIPGNEQLWLINPGESEVLIGENADLFIEGLYKRLVAKKRIDERPDIAPTQARSFNWTDGLLQEQMIDKIYLGIEQPSFSNEPRTSKTPKAS